MKEKKRLVRLEELSETAPTFQQVSELATCEEAREFMATNTRDVRSGRNLDEKMRNTHMMLLADELLVSSGQRTGAVANMTMGEWKKAREVTTDSGNTVHVVSVYNHKTALATGSAKLIMTSDLKQRLDFYAEHIRPYQCAGNEDLFFLLSGGRKINRHAQRIRRLCRVFKVTEHTATDVRRAQATEATMVLSPKKKMSVTTQLCHSVAVEQKYYELNKGVEDAAKSFALMRDTKMGEPSTSGSKNKGSKCLPESSREFKARSFFKQAEIEDIQLFFGEELRTNRCPSRGKCGEFLKQYPIEGRSEKDIQDKVRNLIKKYSKK